MSFAFDITIDDDVADGFFEALDGDDIEAATPNAEHSDDDEETLCL